MNRAAPPRHVSPQALAKSLQAKATYPTTSAWVSASAGSGKTTVLTNRVLALLLKGIAPSRILCLTFTKAAAAEMANRIATRLSRWVTATEDELDRELADLLPDGFDRAARMRSRRLFAAVLDTPGGLQIATLHAFCQSLLRRFPLEAGVAPHFTLIDERDSDEALLAAREETLAAARNGGDAALRAATEIITTRIHESSFGDLMADLVKARGRLAALLAGGGDAAAARIARCLGLAPGTTDADLVQAAVAAGAFAGDDLARAAAALDRGTDTDRERAQAIRSWLGSSDRAAGLDAYRSAFLTGQGEPRKRLATQTACQHWPEAETVLRTEAARLIALQERRRAAEVALCSAALLRIGAAVLARYEREKAHRNWIDYDDLIRIARRLLEREDFAAWVLFKLDGGIDHVLVDEAQDTNPDQWAILRALTAEFFAGEGRSETVRTVFAVGDRKQSIFSFQGAAPDEFDRMQARTAAQVEGAGAHWASVTLNVSFRSVRAVLDAVDAVFRQPAARAGVAAGPDPLVHLAAREGAGGLVEVWPLAEPSARDDLPAWKPPVEQIAGDDPQLRLAALVAKRIAHMIESREMLAARGRPIRPGDIMVLVRRRTRFIDELVRRLKQRGIAIAGVDRMVLTEQLAVMDLMALGQFLLLPDDDLTLATVLKGPLVGLTEEELFTLAHGRGTRRLWDVLKAHAGAASRFGAAHRWLADLLARVDYATPAELYAHVLVAGDGRRKILSRLGVDADDPIDEFLRLALAYQEIHPPSLQGFLHWLAGGQAEIKRDLDQSGADAVRIITVHGAKGLQAPIVFLPDTAQVPTARPRLLWTADTPPLMLWPPRGDAMDGVCTALREDADAARDAEYRRLLYVAMTRAEDRLYVCGWQTRRPAAADRTWYGLIRGGLDGLPGVETVTDAFLAADGTLPSAAVLRLACAQTAAPELASAAPATAAPEPLPAWATEAAPPEETPPRPLAPSQAARPDPPALAPLADGGDRFQRGLIVHRLLQSLPDLPPERRRAAAEAFVARPAWGLSADSRAALVAETLAVLETSAFAALFGPNSLAEVPISGLVHGHAVSGQVDRLAVAGDEVLIVDYKTNRPPPRRAADVDPAYAFQMAVYRAALAAIYPRHRVRCLLLWTDGPFALELPGKQLDAALASLAPEAP